MSGYALCVGINRFDRDAYGGQDIDLAACEADAEDMATIASKLGYADTCTLLSEEATRERILSEVARIAAAAEPGDTVLLSASTHGALVPALDGDDDVKPHLGENAILAFDGMIPDDAIWREGIARFREGVRVATIWDLCHAEDAIRFYPREGSIRSPCRAAIVAAARDPGFKELRGPRAEARAAVAALYACKKEQYALDGKGNGAFTAAFKLALPGVRSWQRLRDGIAAVCPRSQTPVLRFYGSAGLAFRTSRPLVLPEAI